MAKENKKLLIVDDEEPDRETLKSILRSEFSILEADSGFSALKIISEKKNELDAILLDVSMPVMNGFGVLKNMKAKKIRNICVFLITSEATKENVEKAAEYHVSEFIKKPFERDEIINRLKTKLEMI